MDDKEYNYVYVHFSSENQEEQVDILISKNQALQILAIS